jgi:hypothetical protein
MRARSNINLGLVASHKRTIKSGTEYNKYFDTSAIEGKEVELMAEGDVYDTLKLMQKIVRDTLPQTKKIAQILKGSSTEGTCANVWNFLYTHIQYKKDNPLREQLRTPIRSWKDRATGIDCDCYAIFISSILANLGIPHSFRMAAYKGDFQHVYVVVKNKGNTIVIDPVLDTFNQEAPYSKKYDHTMTKVTMLNGVGDAACNTKPIRERLRRYMSTEQVKELGYVPTQQFLEANNIPYVQVIDEETEGGMFQIMTPGGSENIKPILTKEEAQAVLASLAASPVVNTPVATSQQPAQTTPVASDTSLLKKFPWLLAAAAVVGGLILITGKEERPTPQALAGVPKKIKRSSPKVKTLYV